MRIIAGEYKGRRLMTPADRLIRPTSDKVREALFSILAPDLDQAEVCDLFAGTGGLGLEALSRGARFCWFADHASESIKLVRKNVALCRAEGRCRIIHGDYRKVLSSLDHPVNLFFLDPPYRNNLILPAMQQIQERNSLAEGGKIICEHHKETDLPEEVQGYRKIKERKYVRVVLSIYM